MVISGRAGPVINKIGIKASALNLINKNQSNDRCFLKPINESSVIYLTGGNPRYLNTILQILYY